MLRSLLFVIATSLIASAFAGCSGEPERPPSDRAAAAEAPPSARAADIRTGTVQETINAAGYTYIEVDTGSDSFWAAAPSFAVKVGDPVAVPAGMPMQDFHSSALNRDFDVVYFVDGVQVGNAQPGGAPAAESSGLPAGHPPLAAAQTSISPGDIEPLEGGRTVAEIIAESSDLSGKTVSFRGEVVKFNANIMGSNWLHVQDGTGSSGENDLTVTSTDVASVGDIVTVTGVLATDKDFGAGYAYDVIIEDARVTVE